jgi:hypothetical protein
MASAHTLAALAAAASRGCVWATDARRQMRRWSRGIYADHTDRTRREESAAAIFRVRLASPRSKGLGRPAPALRARQPVEESSVVIVCYVIKL